MLSARSTVQNLLLASLFVVAAHQAAHGADEIVLHPADVSYIAGSWIRASSTTGAGGLKMTTVDRALPATSAPAASPVDYFEATFDASAGTTYQVWLRLRAAGNSKWNESVWVQFDNAIDGAGRPLWPIGSTSGLLVNLEDCIGCGVAGWGWQDNASWTGQAARVRFAASGTHRIRVQVREDGVDVDQIVLSPARWLTTPPGAVRNDTTVLPRTSTRPTITFVRDPYVQQVAATSAYVVWATREAGTAHVRYQAGGGAVASVAGTSRFVTTSTTGMAVGYYQHEARLASLMPGTRYSYQVAVGGVTAGPVATLTTAPSSDAATVRFIAFGDSGVGSPAQRQLALRMAGEPFDFAVITGDVAYGGNGFGAGGYPQLHNWMFDVYRSWLGSRPVYPAIGNHDDEANFAAPYRDLFVLPGNGASAPFPDHAERFYSFDYGAAHIVVLDTELAFQNLTRRQAQLAWLVDDLARTTRPWKIAVFHRSPFSAGGEHQSDLAVRAELAPIFEAHGVSLVLSGHEHDYERTVPWSTTSSGAPVTYVVTGGGGAPLYPAGTGPWTAVSRSVHHYVRGVISSCTIGLEAVGLDGSVFDRATLQRCTTSPPPPGPTGSTPYGGTPARVPGIVQAENFDEGGSGVAYRDEAAGNEGGAYRQTAVDIQATADEGGGYNVGWMTAGEWLAYTVDVAAAGSYRLDVRVASVAAGGRFHLESNGVDVSGPMTMPNTGGWQIWRTVIVPSVALAAGQQRLRLVLDANSPSGLFGNINRFAFTLNATTP
jgi:3',5'-cyclic AMP phosphodiesterase CpdA